MNLRKTVNLDPLDVEDITDRIDGILDGLARAGRDDRAYFELQQLRQELRMQLARERQRENSRHLNHGATK